MSTVYPLPPQFVNPKIPGAPEQLESVIRFMRDRRIHSRIAQQIWREFRQKFAASDLEGWRWLYTQIAVAEIDHLPSDLSVLLGMDMEDHILEDIAGAFIPNFREETGAPDEAVTA